MITTKRTDRGRLYENHSAVPGNTSSGPAGHLPLKGKASEEPDARTLCPMTRKTCLGRRCVHFDEDYDVCGMSPLSFYNQIRDAVTDAAVEIINVYGKEAAT